MALNTSGMSKRDDVVQRDVFKMQRALENGMSVVRISQRDVYDNRINWKKLLQRTLASRPDAPTVVYHARDDAIYDEQRRVIGTQSQ
jgi:hypothetical protein